MNNTNDVKKQLYKENPDAIFIKIVKGVAYYSASLSDSKVHFYIPITDMGDTAFEAIIKAKYLIRWIA